MIEDSIRTYLLAERDLATVPPDRVITILYEELCEMPKDCVGRIYRKLNLTGPDENLAKKLDETSPYSPDKTKRQYSIEQFGLDKAELTDRLSVIFERYGFSTD